MTPRSRPLPWATATTCRLRAARSTPVTRRGPIREPPRHAAGAFACALSRRSCLLPFPKRLGYTKRVVCRAVRVGVSMSPLRARRRAEGRIAMVETIPLTEGAQALYDPGNSCVPLQRHAGTRELEQGTSNSATVPTLSPFKAMSPAPVIQPGLPVPSLPLDMVPGTWRIARLRGGLDPRAKHGTDGPEWRTAMDLKRLGAEVYVPYARAMVRVAGARVAVLRALFGNYVFAAAEPDAWPDIASGEFQGWHRVAHWIDTGDPLKLQPGTGAQQNLVRELVNIQRAMAANPVMATGLDIKPGQRCRVISGPMLGVEGRCLEARRDMIIIACSMLGEMTPLQIGHECLEICD